VHRRLQAGEVVKTLEKLKARIAERFPDAGLVSVCADLVDNARSITARSRRIARPYVFLRALVLAVIVGAVAAQAWLFGHVDWTGLKLNLEAGAVTQAVSSAANLVIVAGSSAWFLLTLEQRIKRGRAMADLHELRSFAHVIDMHQLTKDPTVVLSQAARTASSPVRAMTRFQLTRYLEYCAEMLALTGKLAALYVEHTRDAQVIATVNDIESLCADLGRKIWQKITILSELDEAQAAPVPANAS
jgi:hypothetical protein